MTINEDEIKQDYEEYLDFMNNRNAEIIDMNSKLLGEGKRVYLALCRTVSYQKFKLDYIESMKQMEAIK